MDNKFSTFIHNFIKQYNSDIFSNIPKCKSLLLDHAKGEYKNEIRLLLQALELGCYATIMNSNDLNITRMSLIKQLQGEYYISDNIATSLIDLLLVELRNYKIEQKEQVTKTKSKKNTSNQQNVPSRNQSIQLPASNTNITNIDTSAIQEFSSIISNKVSEIEIFKNKIKLVFEPAFIDYKEIMEKNNLECYYTNISRNKYVSFTFLFLKNIAPTYSAVYNIYFQEDNCVKRCFYLSDSHSYTMPFLFKDDKTYNIEDLTKEVILEELSFFTEKVLLEIKRLKPDNISPTNNKVQEKLKPDTTNKNVILPTNKNNSNPISILGSILQSGKSPRKLIEKKYIDNLKTLYVPAFNEYQKEMNKNKLECEYEKVTQFAIRFKFTFAWTTNILKWYVGNFCPYYQIMLNDDSQIQVDSLAVRYSKKYYDIENYTKEIIISDLNKVMEEVIEEMKKKKII